MSVLRFYIGAPMQYMGNQMDCWPIRYICDSEAERPSSGIPPGSQAFCKDTGKVYRATNATTWVEVGGGGPGGASAWGGITGTLSDQSDLQTALNGKAASGHNHDVSYSAVSHDHAGIYAAAGHNHAGVYAPVVHNHDAAYAALSHTHASTAISDSTATGRSLVTAADAAAARAAIGAGTSSFNGAYASLSGIPATFAPAAHTHSAADITTGVMATARLGTGTPDNTKFLRGDGAWEAPGGGGSDPWTYLRLASDFTTSSATAVDITGLGFTPAANTRYEFVARLMVRTATATVGPRPGVAWPTGMTDGTVFIQQTSSATANVFANGNTAAAVLAPVGGLPNTTQSWPALIEGMAVSGASPSGSIRLQLASETAGTIVRAVAGSFIKYRTIP